MKLFNFTRFFESKRFMLILSFICAIITWFIIVNTIENEISREVVGIPVDIDAQIDSLNHIGLRLTDVEEALATVEVHGPRAQVGGLEADDFYVTASLSGISGPGVYNLRLSAAKVDINGDYQIFSVKPETLQVRIDRQATQSFELKPDIRNASIPNGYMMEKYFLSPEIVTVTASNENIAKIDRASVLLDLDQPLENTTTMEGTIVLYDRQGREIPLDNYILTPETVTVTIPVLKLKTLDLCIDFVNYPSNFDPDTLEWSMSTSTIDVAGPADQIDALNELHLGYIDIRSLIPGSTFNYDITLPDNFINIKNINTTILTFPLEGYAEQEVDVTNIVLINEPANFDIKVLTESLSAVRVMGPEEVLETLTGEELAVELDLSKHEITEGQYNLPVSIVIPTRDGCWSVGEYTVVIKVEQK